MKKAYPFDPLLKHHIIIGLALVVWIFIFLYFTEPLDINELTESDKLIYLPGYAMVGCVLYLLILPIQFWFYRRNNKQWFVKDELILTVLFFILATILLRFFYLAIVMDWHPYAYGFWYHFTAIIIPAIATVLPIVIIARFAFGKYHEKRLDDKKVEIKGEGNYEGLRLQFNDIISIQSSDNYIEVFYVSANDLKKTLIRNKLSSIDAEFDNLHRAHRSYLINPFHFQQWKTENGKLSMLLNYNIEVPISKTYQSDIKNVIQLATN